MTQRLRKLLFYSLFEQKQNILHLALFQGKEWFRAAHFIFWSPVSGRASCRGLNVAAGMLFLATPEQM